MLVKINKKPIHVVEETEKSTSIPYILVSTFGYFSIIYLLDYVYFTFFYKHLFPVIATIGKVLFFFI